MTPSTKKALLIIPVALVLGIGGGAAAKYDQSEPQAVMAQFQVDMTAGVDPKIKAPTKAEGLAGLRMRMDPKFIAARNQERIDAPGSAGKAALTQDDMVRSVAMHAVEGDAMDVGRIMSMVKVERTGLDEFRAHHDYPGSNVLVFRRSMPLFGTWKLVQVVPAPAGPKTK